MELHQRELEQKQQQRDDDNNDGEREELFSSSLNLRDDETTTKSNNTKSMGSKAMNKLRKIFGSITKSTKTILQLQSNNNRSRTDTDDDISSISIGSCTNNSSSMQLLPQQYHPYNAVVSHPTIVRIIQKVQS